MGLPPLLALGFIVLIWSVFFRRNHFQLSGVLQTLVISFLMLSLFLITDDQGHSLWYLVYNFVPGAASLRAVFRIYLLVQWGLLFVIGKILLKHSKGRGRLFPKIVTVGIAALLILEPIRISPATWKSDEYLPVTAKSLILSLETKDCSAFYLVDKSGTRGFVQTNGDAIAISTYTGVPTINGATSQSISGWSPLQQPNLDTLQSDISNWIGQFQLRSKPLICIESY
jgi:hypothetical protein